MQILIATSRSINQDRIYQLQQQKNKKILNTKIKIITQNKLEPLRPDLTYEKNLRKAKSAAKIFQKSQEKIQLRRQNKVLLQKLMNVKSSLKNIRLKSNSKQKNFVFTSSNWIIKKNEEQKIKKQNQSMKKRFDALSSTNVKQFKKKLHDQIKDYVELKNKIRKMKPIKHEENQKSLTSRSHSQRKIKISLPLFLNKDNTNTIQNQQQKKITENNQKQMRNQNQIRNQKSQKLIQDKKQVIKAQSPKQNKNTVEIQQKVEIKSQQNKHTIQNNQKKSQKN